MKYQNFEEVLQLDINSQRNLLQVGKPLEKLWTAWSLDLNSDPSLKPRLISEIYQGATPGLRTKFVILLSGMGERVVLERLAIYDTDEYVREAACHNLLQTADHDGRLQALLVKRLLADESSIVRMYILQQAIRNFPVLDRSQLEALLSDQNEEIQAAAFGLLSQYDYGWTMQYLPMETGLKLVYEAFFKWVLWKTGYERHETAERMAEGLGMTHIFSQKLVAISKKVPDVEIFRHADWFKRRAIADPGGANLEVRKDVLVSRLRELGKEPGLDFLTEMFVSRASGNPNSGEIIFELGKRMYYVT